MDSRTTFIFCSPSTTSTFQIFKSHRHRLQLSSYIKSACTNLACRWMAAPLAMRRCAARLALPVIRAAVLRCSRPCSAQHCLDPEQRARRWPLLLPTFASKLRHTPHQSRSSPAASLGRPTSESHPSSVSPFGLPSALLSIHAENVGSHCQ